ncbi:MAG: nucleotidyl transferase AbiEii/AbiGii toxin family protein [Candidatus Binatia bacterium]
MATAEGLRFDQVEKDYVILWILHAFSRPEFFVKAWVFKGGTCLRHCYYPGYRFSEDLDFTCQPESGSLDAARMLFNSMARWIQETSGIRMETKDPHTIPGDFQVEIPLEYARGGRRTRGLPSAKIHLTFDEPILTEVVACTIKPRYSDLSEFQITAYSKKEIVAEKMRALLQQQKKWPRPRDLYDLWFVLCRSAESFDAQELKGLFAEKCKVRQIKPDMAGLTSENLRDWNKEAWENQMKPIMKRVPEFDEVWQEWVTKFHDIFG